MEQELGEQPEGSQPFILPTPRFSRETFLLTTAALASGFLIACERPSTYTQALSSARTRAEEAKAANDLTDQNVIARPSPAASPSPYILFQRKMDYPRELSDATTIIMNNPEMIRWKQQLEARGDNVSLYDTKEATGIQSDTDAKGSATRIRPGLREPRGEMIDEGIVYGKTVRWDTELEIEELIDGRRHVSRWPVLFRVKGIYNPRPSSIYPSVVLFTATEADNIQGQRENYIIPSYPQNFPRFKVEWK